MGHVYRMVFNVCSETEQTFVALLDTDMKCTAERI